MIDSGDYATRMQDVYAHIYREFYELSDAARADVRQRVLKNLGELDIPLSRLKEMAVFNVGPVREAVMLHELGARQVFHFDVSRRAVDKITTLKATDPDLGNLHSEERDICRPGVFDIPGGIDLVYLSGVLHHLIDPETAMENLFPSLNTGARLFFRIYRSGCIGFFCAEFSRRIVDYTERHAVIEAFDGMFDRTERQYQSLYEDMYDNLFVPVQSLYTPAELDGFFAGLGARKRAPVKPTAPDTADVSYDHADNGLAAFGRSLYYEYTGDRSGHSRPFPRHIDQINGIDYKEPFINRTVEWMNALISNRQNLSLRKRAALAVDVYVIGQTRRFPDRVTAESLHKKIQGALSSFL